MALVVAPGQTFRAFMTLTLDTGDGNGPQPQSVMPAGQTPGITTADSADFSVVLDNPPVQPDPDPVTGVIPLTVASAVVTTPASPSQPSVPVDITFTATNADGSNAAPPDVDTITVVVATPPIIEAIGDLFGTPVAVVASAKKK